MLVLGGAAREDLARFCLEPDTAEAKRALAWVNAICLAYLVIGLLGLRPPPIYVVKHPLPEEAVPTVIEPLISAVQQIAPDSAAEEAPSEQTSDEAPGVAVVADSAAVAFSVPTVGNVLVPMSMAQAPPAHPMAAATPIRTPHIEQITTTGTGGSRPAPPYPIESRMHREEGTVLLLIEVDESGKIASVAVKESSGYTRLDQGTTEYVRRHWFFGPAKGTRWYESPIIFQIR